MSVEQYFENISKPWSKMYYDLVFKQLNIISGKKLKILDFGSGFGVVANHYAALHDVTAVEPNIQMINRRFAENHYLQIHGGLEDIKNNVFDIILCHNVLEYVENKDDILLGLEKLLLPRGLLSIVKHNELGKVMQNAVFSQRPADALKILQNNDISQSMYFGDIKIYSNNWIIEFCSNLNLKVEKLFGIRTFFALTQNNDVKFDLDWYKNMLELEIKAAEIPEFIAVAFFNHIVFKKDDLNELLS